jgi:hypothetical protein
MDTMMSLWVGPRLGTIERLSISSYLANGHPFDLYAYGPIAGVPAGATVRDANEVLPEGDIKKFKHFANFSDLWRYTMLFEKGGWWVDLDTVCLRPFGFKEERILSAETDELMARHAGSRFYINASTMRMPKGDPMMEWLVRQVRQMDWQKMEWAAAGPIIVTKAVMEFKLPFMPPVVFNPIRAKDYIKLVGVPCLQVPKGAYAIHFYHSMWVLWGKQKLNPDATYPRECLYEQLKRRFSVASNPGPRRWQEGWREREAARLSAAA